MALSDVNLFKLFDKNKKKQNADSEITGSSSGVKKSPAEVLGEGMVNVRDVIAPSAIEIDFNNLRIGNSYYRTFFVSGYPRFVGANWLSPIINFDHSLDISFFYYPVKSKVILDDLRRKITELEATMMSNQEKGRITDPVVKAALSDAQALQEQLVKGIEKYFQFSFYITVPATSLDELEETCARLESTLGSLLLISKAATLQMEQAFQSTLPMGSDKLLITRNMDTTSLATTFPFTSSNLTMDEGIMYGINKHNGSLVIFDRFSLENANTVVFAKSGAGKSYYVKLEALRLMVFGAEVMIIDPEEEYRALCGAVGGDYIDFSANSESKINPFDLSGVAVEGENELGQKILSLHTLLKLMLGNLSPTEEAILDRALIETYRIMGITPDPETQMTKTPPVMEDLYKILIGANEPEARSMAEKLEKFIKGSMAGIFDSQSNVDINNKMTVFSTKNLEETLRPIAFYIILDFIWTRIRKDLRKRTLIVEEAWYLMQHEDSARFIYGIAKRARKYYLGLTAISQDVDDFLTSEYGKAIVTNSSIQVLFKQHPAAIDQVADVFYLSEGEKRFLLSAAVGEGLFFAGSNHVAIKVVASEAEHNLVTTNPAELIKLKEEGLIKEKEKQLKPVYRQYIPPKPQENKNMNMNMNTNVNTSTNVDVNKEIRKEVPKPDLQRKEIKLPLGVVSKPKELSKEDAKKLMMEILNSPKENKQSTVVNTNNTNNTNNSNVPQKVVQNPIPIQKPIQTPPIPNVQSNQDKQNEPVLPKKDLFKQQNVQNTEKKQENTVEEKKEEKKEMPSTEEILKSVSEMNKPNNPNTSL